MKTSIAFALVGLALLYLLLSHAGLGDVADAIASAGWSGLAALVAWQLLLTIPVALAWQCVCPQAGVVLLAWGRLVREAVGACLPFTVVGGFVAGARVLASRPAIGWATAGASIAADVTLEFVAEIAFVGIALGLLILRNPHSPLLAPVGWSALAATVVAVVALGAQGRLSGGLRWFSRRFGLSQVGETSDRGVSLTDALDRIYADRRRLAAGAALHLAGWAGGSIGTWIAFNLLGAHIGLDAALVIEALLSFARAIAFFVPGSIGVQEAALVALGSLFGVDDHLSLGVSLLRRARDLAIGVPVLVAWYVREAQGTRARRTGGQERSA